MGATGATGPEPSWGEIMGELWLVISSPLSADGERLLLDVIHHQGPLRLTETAELPHSLPPDEMLKSLAVQALARWTRCPVSPDRTRWSCAALSSRTATGECVVMNT